MFVLIILLGIIALAATPDLIFLILFGPLLIYPAFDFDGFKEDIKKLIRKIKE